MYKKKFLDAIMLKTKVKLTFYCKEDGANLTRLCAPMDYGPFKAAKMPTDRYHLWDYQSDKKNHSLSLLPDQIIAMEFLDDLFDPSEFITWRCTWHVKRDWGIYS